MRWKVKNKPKPEIDLAKSILIGRKGPSNGDLKEKIRFAFFPVKLDEGNMVWLEKYVEVWKYDGSYPLFFSNEFIYFKSNCWELKSKKLL